MPDEIPSKSVPAAKRAEEVRTTELVFPNDINHYGTLFGGRLLELMDKTAFLAATRFSGEPCVTASLDRVDFRVPIRLGDCVEIVARVVYTGRTSVMVRVDAYASPPAGGERKLCTTGTLTMVAVNESGKPLAVPALDLRGPEEKREFDKAKSLRESWLQARSTGSVPG